MAGAGGGGAQCSTMKDTATALLGGEPHYYYGEGNKSRPRAQCEWPADWEVSFSLLPVSRLLLGLLGNGLVSFTVWQDPRAKRLSATYIGNLALADLAIAVTRLLWAAYMVLCFHWPFSLAWGKLSRYLVLLNMFASAACLVCLSVQHYVAIVHLCANLAARALPAVPACPAAA